MFGLTVEGRLLYLYQLLRRAVALRMVTTRPVWNDLQGSFPNRRPGKSNLLGIKSDVIGWR